MKKRTRPTFGSWLLKMALGRRLPILDGTIGVSGLRDRLTIRREEHGIPIIEATNDADAWFGLGFCHGQDRSTQLELYQRLVRGTLSAMVGPDALPVDRVCRRVGFRRSSLEQAELLAPAVRETLESYVAGVNAGRASSRRPHELALLRQPPTPWDIADPLGFLKFQSFMMASNWDVELARLFILLNDGPGALQALDPAPLAEQPHLADGLKALLEELAADVAALGKYAPFGAASNNWAIAGRRTTTGRPLLASDPHLAPQAPSPWYLASLRAPGWSLHGASFVGSPTVPIGHNGVAAWGVTAGLLDNTDLFIERLGPDGRSVTRPDGARPCEVIEEIIEVRGRAPVTERLLISPNGPIISRVGADVSLGFALRATWLDPRPLNGWFSAQQATSFTEFRAAFEQWPGFPQHLVYADQTGDIGRTLVGDAPVRRADDLPLPKLAWLPGAGWNDGLVPYEKMPRVLNPAEGFVASANGPPRPCEVPLGVDWLETDRIEAIEEKLGENRSWSMDDCRSLQGQLSSRPWRAIRETVLRIVANDPSARIGLELLRAWDGQVAADSSAASVFELFLAALIRDAAQRKAPRSWEQALGKGFAVLHSDSFFCHRRVGPIVRLIQEQPDGWFESGWASAIESALKESVNFLRDGYGADPSQWTWGRVRPIRFQNPMFRRSKRLGPIFELQPPLGGGDTTTVSQASIHPLRPTDNPSSIPGVRALFDVGDWANSQFSLAGGQSANPYSPYFDDQYQLYAKAKSVTLPWTPEQIQARTRHALTLEPSPLA
jgi:penicillin amidase